VGDRTRLSAAVRPRHDVRLRVVPHAAATMPAATVVVPTHERRDGVLHTVAQHARLALGRTFRLLAASVTDADARRAVRDSAAGAGWVLRRRRPVPVGVEAALRAIERRRTASPLRADAGAPHTRARSSPP